MRIDLLEQGIELNLASSNDLKNFLAWLSFEERAREIYDEFEMKR